MSESGEDVAVYESLVAYGAPLAAWAPQAVLALEDALAQGLRLSHEDATLLRVLPVVFARNAPQMDWQLLRHHAHRLQVEAELGLLLELTARLTGSSSLWTLAKGLEHARRAEPSHYFRPRGRFERELAERKTPEVALRWGFFMNMPEGSFASLLAKHGA